ncbi:MAG: 16S rRNA (guanine(527)-N(7))-methyltransferase RsmG [Limnochordaceae bacterium]|nr:16S rRNA (guanine(527)-N(7))-methyltransferase RsmG [Limnochordaceae bacterium]
MAGSAGRERQVEWLIGGARALGVELGEEQADALLRLTELLVQGTRRASLTAITDPGQILVKHHLDSLSVVRWIGAQEAGSWADVGSGAGFPGLPLAIARPRLQVVLIESVLRKVEFLEQAVRALGLGNVQVVRERAEVLARQERWRESLDGALARALGSLAVSVELCAPLVRVGGRVLIMKGPAVAEEWEAGQQVAVAVGLGPLRQEALTLPGGDRRVLVMAEKVRTTPGRFPRRPGRWGRPG